MTADIATQKNSSVSSAMLNTLTLAFAIGTLCLALLSIVMANRLSSLQTHLVAVNEETTAVEATATRALETALAAATNSLETTQQKLEEEKTAVEHLRRQLAAVMKDLEKTKSELEQAHQIIANFKTSLTPPPAPVLTQADPAAPQATDSLHQPADRIPPTTAEPSSAGMPPIAEETIGETPQTLPKPAPADQ